MTQIQANTVLSVSKFSDPEHGWLRVKLEWLVALGIEHDITNFSFVKPGKEPRTAKWVYLEEDHDASIFAQAAKDHGWAYMINESNTKSRSFIRRLPSFRDYFEI